MAHWMIFQIMDSLVRLLTEPTFGFSCAASNFMSLRACVIVCTNEIFASRCDECRQMKQWAEVDLPPGQFLGSTGVQTLTPEELGTEDRRFQAWVKKVEFCSAVRMELEFCSVV